MNKKEAHPASYGPWLVGLGAALWGTESAWRIPLNNLFDAQVIVFWEHVLILLMFLPILIPRLGELRKIDARTWGYLIFSGFAGSAVGTVFFTLALKNGNPTVVNVILNIQPVISTLGAYLLFSDRLTPRFFLYASIAIVAGIFLSVEHPDLDRCFVRASRIEPRHCLRAGVRALLGTFHRGRTRRHDRHVASTRRQSARRRRTGVHDDYSFDLRKTPWPVAVAGRGTSSRRHRDRCAPSARLDFRWHSAAHLLRRAAPDSRASTAGYFEMMQTLAAVCITWGFFHATLHTHQIVAAIVLMAAVVMVQKRKLPWKRMKDRNQLNSGTIRADKFHTRSAKRKLK